MRVSLFATCLVDQFWPSVGHATTKILSRVGCRVAIDLRQTCCSQPAFNTGHHREARPVAEHFLEIYDREEVDAVVMPSGSCAAMIQHLTTLFPSGHARHESAQRVAAKTHDLAMFLVNVLGVEDLGAASSGCVTWHDGCHGLRDLGSFDEPRRLLQNVRGIRFLEFGPEPSCCGFGGTFSVTHADLSTAILDRKLERVDAAIDTIVSGDVSCLLHIEGRLARQGSKVRVRHLADVLAEGWE